MKAKGLRRRFLAGALSLLMTFTVMDAGCFSVLTYAEDEIQEVQESTVTDEPVVEVTTAADTEVSDETTIPTESDIPEGTTPVSEETTVTDETTVPEDTSLPEDTSVPDDTSETDETSVTDETSEEETSVPEETTEEIIQELTPEEIYYLLETSNIAVYRNDSTPLGTGFTNMSEAFTAISNADDKYETYRIQLNRNITSDTTAMPTSANEIIFDGQSLYTLTFRASSLALRTSTQFKNITVAGTSSTINLTASNMRVGVKNSRGIGSITATGESILALDSAEISGNISGFSQVSSVGAVVVNGNMTNIGNLKIGGESSFGFGPSSVSRITKLTAGDIAGEIVLYTNGAKTAQLTVTGTVPSTENAISFCVKNSVNQQPVSIADGTKLFDLTNTTSQQDLSWLSLSNLTSSGAALHPYAKGSEIYAVTNLNAVSVLGGSFGNAGKNFPTLKLAMDAISADRKAAEYTVQINQDMAFDISSLPTTATNIIIDGQNEISGKRTLTFNTNTFVQKTNMTLKGIAIVGTLDNNCINWNTSGKNLVLKNVSGLNDIVGTARTKLSVEETDIIINGNITSVGTIELNNCRMTINGNLTGAPKLCMYKTTTALIFSQSSTAVIGNIETSVLSTSSDIILKKGTTNLTNLTISGTITSSNGIKIKVENTSDGELSVIPNGTKIFTATNASVKNNLINLFRFDNKTSNDNTLKLYADGNNIRAYDPSAITVTGGTIGTRNFPTMKLAVDAINVDGARNTLGRTYIGDYTIKLNQDIDSDTLIMPTNVRTTRIDGNGNHVLTFASKTFSQKTNMEFDDVTVKSSLATSEYLDWNTSGKFLFIDGNVYINNLSGTSSSEVYFERDSTITGNVSTFNVFNVSDVAVEIKGNMSGISNLTYSGESYVKFMPTSTVSIKDIRINGVPTSTLNIALVTMGSKTTALTISGMIYDGNVSAVLYNTSGEIIPVSDGTKIFTASNVQTQNEISELISFDNNNTDGKNMSFFADGTAVKAYNPDVITVTGGSFLTGRNFPTFAYAVKAIDVDGENYKNANREYTASYTIKLNGDVTISDSTVLPTKAAMITIDGTPDDENIGQRTLVFTSRSKTIPVTQKTNVTIINTVVCGTSEVNTVSWSAGGKNLNLSNVVIDDISGTKQSVLTIAAGGLSKVNNTVSGFGEIKCAGSSLAVAKKVTGVTKINLQNSFGIQVADPSGILSVTNVVSDNTGFIKLAYAPLTAKMTALTVSGTVIGTTHIVIMDGNNEAEISSGTKIMTATSKTVQENIDNYFTIDNETSESQALTPYAYGSEIRAEYGEAITVSGLTEGSADFPSMSKAFKAIDADGKLKKSGSLYTGVYTVTLNTDIMSDTTTLPMYAEKITITGADTVKTLSFNTRQISQRVNVVLNNINVFGTANASSEINWSAGARNLTLTDVDGLLNVSGSRSKLTLIGTNDISGGITGFGEVQAGGTSNIIGNFSATKLVLTGTSYMHGNVTVTDFVNEGTLNVYSGKTISIRNYKSETDCSINYVVDGNEAYPKMTISGVVDISDGRHTTIGVRSSSETLREVASGAAIFTASSATAKSAADNSSKFAIANNNLTLFVYGTAVRAEKFEAITLSGAVTGSYPSVSRAINAIKSSGTTGEVTLTINTDIVSDITTFSGIKTSKLNIVSSNADEIRTIEFTSTSFSQPVPMSLTDINLVSRNTRGVYSNLSWSAGKNELELDNVTGLGALSSSTAQVTAENINAKSISCGYITINGNNNITDMLSVSKELTLNGNIKVTGKTIGIKDVYGKGAVILADGNTPNFNISGDIDEKIYVYKEDGSQFGADELIMTASRAPAGKVFIEGTGRVAYKLRGRIYAGTETMVLYKNGMEIARLAKWDDVADAINAIGESNEYKVTLIGNYKNASSIVMPKPQNCNKLTIDGDYEFGFVGSAFIITVPTEIKCASLNAYSSRGVENKFNISSTMPLTIDCQDVNMLSSVNSRNSITIKTPMTLKSLTMNSAQGNLTIGDAVVVDTVSTTGNIIIEDGSSLTAKTGFTTGTLDCSDTGILTLSNAKVYKVQTEIISANIKFIDRNGQRVTLANNASVLSFTGTADMSKIKVYDANDTLQNIYRASSFIKILGSDDVTSFTLTAGGKILGYYKTYSDAVLTINSVRNSEADYTITLTNDTSERILMPSAKTFNSITLRGTEGKTFTTTSTSFSLTGDMIIDGIVIDCVSTRGAASKINLNLGKYTLEMKNNPFTNGINSVSGSTNSLLKISTTDNVCVEGTISIDRLETGRAVSFLENVTFNNIVNSGAAEILYNNSKSLRINGTVSNFTDNKTKITPCTANGGNLVPVTEFNDGAVYIKYAPNIDLDTIVATNLPATMELQKDTRTKSVICRNTEIS